MSDAPPKAVPLNQPVLSKNAALAVANRERFTRQRLFVVNIVSSPGSGKTTLLERTLAELGARQQMAVVVGDLQTDNDARRLRSAAGGAPVEQIVTGTVCHLDADMVARALDRIDLGGRQILFIENVGNLVCPASYDLGEAARVTVLSVTEGEDKPLKYPVIFKKADVILINKVDLAEAVGFDREAALRHLSQVAPQAQVLELSARTGQGMAAWYAFLESHVAGGGQR